MTKPVILAVDDEPEVLSAVERDLRRHYGRDYRILRASSGAEALEAVRELKRRNTLVALLLVDQRMPGMSGTEFLVEAVRIHPEAKKVLLTAYADTQAAITSINQLGLDYYLLKPWEPPERELYPVLDDLLEDWAATVRRPFEGIRVLGTWWSPRSHLLKEFLSHNQIPYRWVDAETDREARSLLAALNGEGRPAAEPQAPASADTAVVLPAVFLPDGKVLIDPTTRELAAQVGLQQRATRPFYDLTIIGGGPAGLAAAVYGGSEGLHTVLVEREATGGQAGTSALIENYLGFPRGLSGADLARRATVQARRFGVEILNEEVVGVRVEHPYRVIRLSDGAELGSQALLIATGVSVRRLEAPGAERLSGAGVYYGVSVSDAAQYRGRDVVVVGGANSAGQGVLFLSRYARAVTLVVRADGLEAGMSRYLVDQIRATGNIRVLLESEVAEVRGDGRLECVLVTARSGGAGRAGEGGPGTTAGAGAAVGAALELPASALFVFIGATAHTDLLDGVVERDPAGFILTGQDLLTGGRRPKGWALERDPYPLETSVPGIFAAGDVRHQSIKRVASAVGEGAVAVSLIHQYLKTV